MRPARRFAVASRPSGAHGPDERIRRALRTSYRELDRAELHGTVQHDRRDVHAPSPARTSFSSSRNYLRAIGGAATRRLPRREGAVVTGLPADQVVRFAHGCRKMSESPPRRAIAAPNGAAPSGGVSPRSLVCSASPSARVVRRRDLIFPGRSPSRDAGPPDTPAPTKRSNYASRPSRRGCGSRPPSSRSARRACSFPASRAWRRMTGPRRAFLRLDRQLVRCAPAAIRRSCAIAMSPRAWRDGMAFPSRLAGSEGGSRPSMNSPSRYICARRASS